MTVDRRQLNGPGNWPKAHPDERFIRHVAVVGDCWVWVGSTSRGGYGRFQVGSQTRVCAHRYAYEVEVGAIPDGYEIDHLCRNRACVRPEHLEAVTRQENCRRAGLARRGVLRGPTEGTRVCDAGHRIDVQIWRVRGGCPWCQRDRRRAKAERLDTLQTHAGQSDGLQPK